MKVLFVGDGKHDVGNPDGPHPDRTPWPVRGVLPLLTRKVIPAIDIADSRALAWKTLDRFPPEFAAGARRPRLAARDRGYPAKIRLAALLAARHGLHALIAVADRDASPDRVAEMDNAGAGHSLPVICGVAIESIEAWTLGAASALAETLGIPLDELRRNYPSLPVESLYEGSGRTEHQPKSLLERLARKGHRHGGLDLREEVAERTDIAELERACPMGFAAFADALRRKLGAA